MQKEKITRTKKEIIAIKQFITSHGFKNTAEFARAINMERQNLSARILGKCNPDIRMLLKWAAVLKCDVLELIELFYAGEYQQYKKTLDNKK